jgi:16S rRNA (cytosine1402-N4)-methyltransferase
VSIDFHIPVLSHEAVELLINPELKNRVFVDGTLGAGGYTKLICEMTDDSDRVIAIDKDLNAISFAENELEFCANKLTILQGNFGEIKKLLLEIGISSISGIVLDLGLSSFQLEHEEGFSYMRDTPLDMRASKNDISTAADVINEYDGKELERIFEEYGDFGKARRLVSAIIQARKKKRIETTFGLAEVIDNEYKIGRKNKMDFLSKIFQALRIEVNNELDNLASVLEQSLELTEPGGRIVVVSYHSLEDRMVKNFFRDHYYKKQKDEEEGKFLNILTKKPVIPGFQEIKNNRRSRSAKLRAAQII